MKCIDCANGAKFGCKYCVNCLQKAKERSARRYEKKKTEKKCKNCGEQVSGKFILCDQCKEIKKSLMKERKTNKLCVTCGKKSATNGTKCLVCYQTYTEGVEQKRNRRLAEGKCAFCEEFRVHTRLCLKHYLQFTSKSHFGTMKRDQELYDLFLKQEGICAYTGRKLTLGLDASLDHIIPKARYGTNEMTNLHWVHQDVNFMKHDLLDAEFLQLIKEIYLNNFSEAPDS